MAWQPPRPEDAWQGLRRHLELSPGFTLCLIFSAQPRLREALKRKLRDCLHQRGTDIEELDPFELPDWRERLAQRVTTSDEAAIAAHSPLWLRLDHHDALPLNDPLREVAQKLRQDVLSLLNERRGNLEADFRRPLIVILPAGQQSLVWTWAPDLWTIRGHVADLELSELEAAELVAALALPLAREELGARSREMELPRDAGDGKAAIAAWEKVAMLARAEPEQVSPSTAWGAVVALQRQGKLAKAQHVAKQSVELATARLIRVEELWQDEEILLRMRDQAVSHQLVGTMAFVRKNIDEAESAFRESLALSRALIERFGEASQTLYVLRASIFHLAQILRANGKVDEARQLLRECVQINRQLTESQKNSPGFLRALAEALDQLGQAEPLSDSLDEADIAFRESLDLRRALLSTLGDQPDALRDLSASLRNVGLVAFMRHNLVGAEEAIRENLALNRNLLEQTGDSPQARTALADSLFFLGMIVSNRGDLDDAVDSFRESLFLRQELADENPTSPEAQQELASILDLLSTMEELRSRLVSMREDAAEVGALVAEHPDDQNLVRRWDEAKAALASLEETLVKSPFDPPSPNPTQIKESPLPPRQDPGA